MSIWPPTLAALKLDMSIAENDTRDDAELTTQLDAAVAFVERVRPEFNYADDPIVELPEPPKYLSLGTLRLARRWQERKMSPAALVSLAELGAARIPSFDPDIDMMLGIGRYTPARFA